MSNKPKTTQDKHKISEIDDKILKHFDIKRRLGKGAYGIVWKALDKKSNEIMAVKKIFDAFRNETDAQRTFREIMFLRAFRSHPNVIQLNNVYKASNNLDIYLSFEFMESDLHNVIKKGTVLKEVHKRYVMYQLLNAIGYIHSGNVIHRDLKPSNILLNSKCRCKIADFGLARSVSNRPTGDSNTSIDPNEPLLTDYVATRWYRAPEILVASKRYTKGIDMWSLGCILGEMIRGKPLFPGSSTVNQMERIVTALPQITSEDVAALGAGFGSCLLNQNTTSKTTLDDLLENSPDEAKRLIKQLLVLDPAKRLTAKQALQNNYVHKFRNPTLEFELNADVLPPFRDDVQLTVPEYRSKLYEIVQQTLEKNINNKNCLNGKHAIISRRDSTKRSETKPTIQMQTATNRKISPAKMEEKRKPTESGSNAKPTLTTTVNRKIYLPQNFTTPPTQTRSNAPLPKAIAASQLKKETYQKRLMLHPKPPAAESNRSSQLKQIALNEKRHSIDCAYSYQKPLNNHQATSSNVPGSYNIHSAKDRKLNHSSMANIAGTSRNFQPEATVTAIPKKFKISKSDILSMTNDGSNYYEKRLKLLEEKIQRHKKEIREFCQGGGSESANMRRFKPAPEAINNNMNVLTLGAIPSRSLNSNPLPPQRYKTNTTSAATKFKYENGDIFGQGDGLSSHYPMMRMTPNCSIGTKPPTTAGLKIMQFSKIV